MTFEDLQLAAAPNEQIYALDIHNFLLENGCKAKFEQKKTSILGSYKFGKPPKTVINLLLKKEGLVVRIYGEHIHKYPDFLNSMTTAMVSAIQKSGECKRLTQNKCSTKCKGYDFTIGDEHFQKCRYDCFEFLFTEESCPAIMQFIKHELTERQNPT